MTQMTQSFKASRALAPCFLGHLGQLKNNDPNDPMACMAMQFKSMTQMTQMTQWHADILTWCMLASAGNMLRHGRGPLAGPPAGRWQYPQCQ
jgi:hypothetical protein